jgi:hypothetical protein
MKKREKGKNYKGGSLPFLNMIEEIERLKEWECFQIQSEKDPFSNNVCINISTF